MKDANSCKLFIVGETTPGSWGNPYRADPGFGMSTSIGAVRYRFPNSSEFEGSYERVANSET